MSAGFGGGHTIEVCPPRTYDFSKIGSDGDATLTVLERVDTSQYDELDLIVRLHSATIGSGGTLEVKVVSDGYTTDDPGTSFFSAAIGTVSFDQDAATGNLEVASVTSKLGSMVAIQVVGDQPATPVTISARLSINLALKISS